MTGVDPRGNPVDTACAPAIDASERALWRMVSMYGDPLTDLDAAIAADPGWVLPHLMKAGWLYSRMDPLRLPAARAALQAARSARPGGLREQRHAEALDGIASGRWPGACRLWGDLLLELPRDALALHWAQRWDGLLGDLEALWQRPTRALPEWEDSDPLVGSLWAMRAYGLEQSNLHGQAEDAARRALRHDASQPWAVYAIAHGLHRQRRFDEVASWLRLHQGLWAEDNGLSPVLWWHAAWARLETLNVQGVLRIVDSFFQNVPQPDAEHRIRTASLLWMLHLTGQDVHAQAQALLARWPLEEELVGWHANHDVQACCALLVAGDIAGAERWIAAGARRVLGASGPGPGAHVLQREVSLPLQRALLAYARGDAEEACTALHALRPQVWRIGGSHADREWVDHTLMAALTRASERRRATLGRALANERRMDGLWQSALSRLWIDAMEPAPPEAG